ncbi:hypothetical protein MWU60_02780 [Yoonia sp. F2084L]|uniref:hypothetical protein n=1 Tax=Yoonia sp. F2084L TaxID=2926419 RepID=UPI001FF5404D|nr:hypothetical protein [Yoonia sp. F2084L]MCK0094484.1 hypothetical protein [Yoonia sp. F2084L]
MQHPAPQPFHTSDRVKATFLTGEDPRLVVSFTGIGKPETRAQDEEFVGYGTQGGRNHVLFVADTLRSWYNDPGIFDEIVAVVERYRAAHGIAETVTFGNSMGGHGAVLFAKALGATCCFSISAQYSADPAVVPEETRWQEYRDKIASFTTPPLADAITPECLYFILHGGGDLERPHWSRFPKGPNIHHYLVAKAGHAVGRRLKSGKLMGVATRYAIAGRPRAFREALQEPLDLHRPV